MAQQAHLYDGNDTIHNTKRSANKDIWLHLQFDKRRLPHAQ